jgi:hypothetical protein
VSQTPARAASARMARGSHRAPGVQEDSVVSGVMARRIQLLEGQLERTDPANHDDTHALMVRGTAWVRGCMARPARL